MPAGPEFLDPALETAPEQQRIETVDQRPQPAGTRDAKMKWREPSQKLQVMAAPCNDFIKIVAIGDCCAGQKQQHFRQREGHPPGLPTILDLREMPGQNGQP
jgi:hypothetical protein